MNLCVMVSTINSGIYAVPNVILDPSIFINYVISHQLTSEEYNVFPKELIRDDIQISQIKGKGVTKSRNNAIRIAEGDIGLFSDDDVVYKFEFFETVLDVFKSNTNLDVAIFKIKTYEGEPEYKSYPDKVIHYDKKSPSVGTIQIAFKLNKIRENKILFDERFGAGNKFLIGSDEQIFLQDCINAGLTVKYFPKYVVIHPYESTVKALSIYDNRRIRVTGGLDARINGPIAIFKSILGTFKFLPDLIRNKKNPIIYFWERFKASVYITFTKSKK